MQSNFEEDLWGTASENYKLPKQSSGNSNDINKCKTDKINLTDFRVWKLKKIFWYTKT